MRCTGGEKMLTLTVKELIGKLQQFDQDFEVVMQIGVDEGEIVINEIEQRGVFNKRVVIY